MDTPRTTLGRFCGLPQATFGFTAARRETTG